MADLIVVEREDGTLLRAKAVPNGMLGYLLGKVVNFSGQIAFVFAVSTWGTPVRSPAGTRAGA